MAWTTPKTFTAGERLFAQDLNTYVSDNLSDLDTRTVKSFADASARSTAIPSPSAGAVTFLEDTDTLEVYDGSGWVSVGFPLGSGTPSDGDILVYNDSTSSWDPTASGKKILQVVTASTTTTTNNTTRAPVATALTATITPQSSTSTIVLYGHADSVYGSTGGNIGVIWVLYKNGSNTGAGNNGSAAGGDAYSSVGSVLYHEQPGSTSAITYTMYIWNSNDTAATLQVAGYQSFVIMELEL